MALVHERSERQFEGSKSLLSGVKNGEKHEVSAPTGPVAVRILELQRAAGNAAVVSLLSDQRGGATPRLSRADDRTVMRDVSGIPPAPSSAAGSPSKDAVQRVYQLLVGHWERLTQVRIKDAAGDKVKAECAVFVELVAEKRASYSGAVRRMVARDLGVEPAEGVEPEKHRSQLKQFFLDYEAGMKKFVDEVGEKVLRDLAAAPDPTGTWQWVQQRLADPLSDGGRGSAFNDRVEDRILGDYETKLAKELKRKPSELQEMADTEVGKIIDTFAANMLIGVTQAGAEFHLPMPVPGTHFDMAKAGSATTLLATELGEMFLKKSGKLLKLGLHVLPFATFALEIYSIWEEANKERERIEKENKRAELEERAKHELFIAEDSTVRSIRSRSDTLAVLVVGEALKRRINPKAAGKHRLEDLVIEQLGLDEDVRDPARVLEKASWKLRDVSRELQRALSE